MSDEPAPTPAPTPKPASRHADQDQDVANLITEIKQMIGAAQGDAALGALLAARGYNAAKLDEGQRLQAAAQDAFNARQTAMAAQKQAASAQADAESAARQSYTDFRKIARTIFTAPADQSALGLTGEIPRDAQKFITTARASYTAAQSAPYAALAGYGFPAEALAALDAFSNAAQAQNAAAAQAVKATADRDAAVDALKQWNKQFKSVAAVALRGQPAQAKKLGL
jgi:hypothetical protein